MAKLVRIYDPDETERRINLIVREAVCPGLLEFLSELPFGNETPLIRGVLYQWFIQHREAGTLDAALNNVLSGPGGLMSIGYQGSPLPPSARHRKRVPKQRSVTAKAGGRQPASVHTNEPALSHSTVTRDSQPDSPPPSRAQPQPPEPHRHTETDLPVPELPVAQAAVVPAPSPPALEPADQHSLPGAQMDVVADGDQLPDAEQVALLNSMGAMFP